MKYKVGDKYPVWWETDERDETDSWYMSRIIEISKYTGVYHRYYEYVFKLVAPSTRRGWIEMTIPKEVTDA